jgi:hypothetical protein
MAEMSFDEEDTALIALVALSSAVMAGLATFAAFGVSLSDTATMGGATFSIAYLATVAAFIWTVLTNEGMSMDVGQLREDARAELDDTYYYLLMGSFVGLAAWPFIPELSSFVQSQDLWGVLFVAGSTGAQVAIGYIK